MLKACNGKWDLFWEGNERLAFRKCVHWEPIAKRQHPIILKQKPDRIKPYSLAVVFGLSVVFMTYLIVIIS